MDYGHVTAGVIDIGPGPLPRQWQDGDILYTGLGIWPPDELLAKDWRPVIGIPPAFDPITEILSAPTFTVETTEINASWTVIALDAAAIEVNRRVGSAGRLGPHQFSHKLLHRQVPGEQPLGKFFQVTGVHA